MLCSLAVLFPTFELPKSTDPSQITRNEDEVILRNEDHLTWHGGFRVGLFVKLIKSSIQTREEIDSLTVPTYIFQGTADKICNPAGSRHMKKVLPELVELHEYQGAVHDLLHELPEVTDKVVCDIRSAVNIISAEYSEKKIIGQVIKRS